MAGKPFNLKGIRSGRLVVLCLTERKQGTRLYWKCQCDCGNITEVSTNNLRSQRTKSCGCLRKESVSTHGACVGRENPLYNIWHGVKQRCLNPRNKFYKYYGGRGVRVCDAWKNDYVCFRDYMLRLPNCPDNVQTVGAILSLEIDRYPNKNGHYEPGNVRWATRKEQQNNITTNVIVKFDGKSMTLQEAVDKHSVCSYSAVYARIKRGWSMKKALLTPSQRI